VKTPIRDCVTKAYESIIASKLAEMRDHCRDFRTLHQAVYDSEACKAFFVQEAGLVACRVWTRLESAPFFDKDFAEKYDVLNKVFPLHEWITGEAAVRKKPVPDYVNDIYNSIVCNKAGVYGSIVGMPSFEKLEKLIRSFFQPDGMPTARLVSLRLWQKLKVFPAQDEVYCAQLKAENQVYDLDAWFTQPEPSAPQPDKAEDVSIKFRNIDYTELEARVMAEAHTYQNQFLSEISDSHLDKNRLFTKALVERFKTEHPNHTLKSLLISTPSGPEIWPRFEPDHREFFFPQPPKKVLTMNANKPYENISYVYGVAATTASDAHLIDSIKRVDTEINRLSDLKGTSKKVDAMVKSLEGDKAAIVAILDSRP